MSKMIKEEMTVVFKDPCVRVTLKVLTLETDTGRDGAFPPRNLGMDFDLA